jgi:4a-hydroxytetrahydrobiopterin dehydratase
MTRSTDDDRARFRSEHPQWEMEGEQITRSFRFADFNEAMGFVTRVALAAEVADHHPDIDIRWNTVTLTLTTHSAGALTENDTSLAAEIDGMA